MLDRVTKSVGRADVADHDIDTALTKGFSTPAIADQRPHGLALRKKLLHGTSTEEATGSGHQKVHASP
jgi:hypothetical protein